MIATVNYSLFPGNELQTFGMRAYATVDAKKSDFPDVVPYLNNLEVKFNVFQSAQERESKNPATKLQGAKDERRNNAILSFRSYGESASLRPIEGWKNAGEAILGVFRKHDWSAHHLGYKAKSGVINNIISEIRTKYATELALIGGTQLLNELEIAQKKFEAAAKQFVEVASTNEPTVAEARPEFIAAIRALFQFIGLQQIAAPSENLTALINTLNELINTSISTLKASDTRSENQKKVNDPNTGTPAI